MLESNSHNLKKLSLDGAGPTVPVNVAARPYPPVVLPQLESLVLGDFLVTYAIFYAGIIHAPNVREITLLNIVGEDHTQLFKVLTGKFPELLIIAIFGLKIRKAAENARIMVQWLLSIPKVKFMRMAGMKADMLDLLCFDGRFHIRNDTPLVPTAEVVQAVLADGSPMNLCPELEAIEVQQVNIESVVKFVSDRMKLEVPLRKLYIHHNSFTNMSADEKAILEKQDYGHDFVYVTVPMSLTPMEESIWKQVRGK
jgi:hypothetical protein